MLRMCDLLKGHGHNLPGGQSRHRGPFHRDGERDTQRGEVTYSRSLSGELGETWNAWMAMWGQD